jgi:glycosyltransferase involved in cell wall biosynthesis
MNVGVYHRSVGWDSVGGIAVFLQKMSMRLASRHTVTMYTSADEEVLPELRNSDVRVVQVDREHIHDLLRPLDEHVFPTSLADNLSFFFASKLAGLLDRLDGREDVLLTGLWPDDILVSRAVDVPVVYEYHSNLRQVGLGTKLHHRLSRSPVRLANSETTARTLETEASISVDGIVNPGVDLGEFEDTDGDRFDASSDHIVTVGRQHREKGIADLVRALDEMESDPILHLVGDGPHAESFDRLAVQLGVDDQVHRHGRVPRDDLLDLYASADVSCNPSHHESWCMTNFEAMAAGTPVVTSNLPAIMEYAEDGENCLLVTPGSASEIADAVDTVLQDEDLAARLAGRGRATAESYSWERQAEALEPYLYQASSNGAVWSERQSTASRGP